MEFRSAMTCASSCWKNGSVDDGQSAATHERLRLVTRRHRIDPLATTLTIQPVTQMKWIRVCAQSELLPGEYKIAWDGDVAIAVFNIDGELYAIEDVCTHDGGELTGGELHGYEIECPRHGARFDVRTGAARCPPAYEPTAVFPVKIEDGVLYTRDDRWD